MLDKKKIFVLIILFIISAAVRLWKIEVPCYVTFDEHYYGSYTNLYLKKSFCFDIHPPLGRLIFFAAAKLSGYDGGFDFEPYKIYSDYFYVYLRFLPALAGIALSIVIFFLIGQLGGSLWAMTFGSLLIIFDNAYIEISQLILPNMFLYFFIALTLLCYWKLKKKLIDNNNDLLSLGVLSVVLGCMISMKWTTLATYCLILCDSIIFIIFFYKKQSIRKKIQKIVLLMIGMIFIPLIIYVTIYYIHLKLIPNDGPGSIYMSDHFKSSLKGSKFENKFDNEMSFIDKFIELHKKMIMVLVRIPGDDKNGSRWWEWPLNRKPIGIWGIKTDNNSIVELYIIGNYFVWYFCSASILFWIGILIFNYCVKNKYWQEKLKDKQVIIFFIIGFFINWLPFSISNRATYLYYYLTPLLFAIVLTVILLDVILKKYKFKKYIYILLIIFCIYEFLDLVPITYGIPVKILDYKTK